MSDVPLKRERDIRKHWLRGVTGNTSSAEFRRLPCACSREREKRRGGGRGERERGPCISYQRADARHGDANGSNLQRLPFDGQRPMAPVAVSAIFVR